MLTNYYSLVARKLEYLFEQLFNKYNQILQLSVDLTSLIGKRVKEMFLLQRHLHLKTKVNSPSA